MTTAAGQGVLQVKWILGVSSGIGGVGKSTVSAHLARALSSLGLKIGLLDADIYGPSQGLLFGVAANTRPESTAGQIQPLVMEGIKLMSMAFMVTEQTPLVWRGPMASSALQQLLLQTNWGTLDLLLVDLPPGTGDIQLTLSQRAKLAGAVVVTTPQNIAVLDAKKAVEMFTKVQVPVLGIIENMSFHQCSACGHQDAIFGEGGADELETQYGVPVLARLPLDASVRLTCDQGQMLSSEHAVAKALITAAQKLVIALEQRQVAAPVILTLDE